MRAIVRSIHSPDVDLSRDCVDDPTDFGFLLQLIVGPAGGEGEESFDVMVCTPTWAGKIVKKQGPLIGRHYLFVERFDVERITDYLRAQVEGLEADTWQGLAEKIARIGKWEFEDYSEKK